MQPMQLSSRRRPARVPSLASPSVRLASFAGLALAALGGGEGAPRLLTLEETAGRGEAVRLVRGPGAWSWAEDGRLVQRTDEGRRFFDPATGEELASEVPAGTGEGADDRERPDAGAEAPRERAARRRAMDDRALDELRAALAALEGVGPELAAEVAKGRWRMSEDGATKLSYHQGLWVHRADTGARRITADPAAELAQLSPDGLRLSFVLANDLYAADVATGAVTRLTHDGSPSLLNGKLDWVYQEEIYGRGDFQGSWWSPDSRHVAFLTLDESAVHAFTVVDHVEDGHFRVAPEVTHYPKAGDPNPTVALSVADATTGELRRVDLERYAASEPLIVRVGWTPDGARLLFAVQDRIQTWADFVAWDPASGEARTWIEERSTTWVERPSGPRWLADGSFLWVSDRTGYAHLYRYAADGKPIGAVTSGEWAMRDVREIDEAAGLLWFTGTKDGAVDVNLYRIGLDGSGLKRLTQGPGTHSTSFSPDRAYFLDTVSSLSSPPEVRLCSGEGEVLRVLDRAEVAADVVLSTWELVRIPARDGFELDAAVLRPVPFDPEREHPVWITTYSGPDAPTVRNRWSSGTWEQFLAQRGIVVFQVNVRSASGKGHWATSQCYQRLGVQELADLEDAVDWLTAHPWADAERVGITGHSYGGFMTAFALTHSERFALGVAGSGVYDWGMYDTIYTERYMRTPALNPEGYAATSVIGAAERLHGHLVITHGEIDDNVHLQNAMHLALALQRADKDFEMMIYPQARHGLRDAAQRWFARKLEWDAIRRVLLDGHDPAPG